MNSPKKRIIGRRKKEHSATRCGPLCTRRQGVPRWDRVINVVINETRLSLCISFLRRPDENRIPFCLDESILAFGIQSAALDISKQSAHNKLFDRTKSRGLRGAGARQGERGRREGSILQSPVRVTYREYIARKKGGAGDGVGLACDWNTSSRAYGVELPPSLRGGAHVY